ncbi:MAG: hypothetical protein H7338_19390, partial [Candidatus Sericytochromatia bacterium]|nr:hypothetical protein [Candidatus Sericytochromatia bacterium]
MSNKRPALIRYLGLELALLVLAGSIYWWKTTYPDAAEPVPMQPVVGSAGTGAASGSQSIAARSLPVTLADTPESAGLALTVTASVATPLPRGATYHLAATLTSHGQRPLRQLRLVI